jgi:hypothetical protein
MMTGKHDITEKHILAMRKETQIHPWSPFNAACSFRLTAVSDCHSTEGNEFKLTSRRRCHQGTALLWRDQDDPNGTALVLLVV